MTVCPMACGSKQMQHSRLLGSTRSCGVTDTRGSWRMVLVAAGGGARDGSSNVVGGWYSFGALGSLVLVFLACCWKNCVASSCVARKACTKMSIGFIMGGSRWGCGRVREDDGSDCVCGRGRVDEDVGCALSSD